MEISESRVSNISKNTKISLALVASLIVAVCAGTYQLTSMRNEDMNQLKGSLQEIKDELTEQKYANQQSLREMQMNVENRILDLERQRDTQWTASMMEIWVLRSQQDGTLAEPGPIIEQYR